MRLKFTILLLLTTFFSAICSADELSVPTPSPSDTTHFTDPINMDEIVVTATRTPRLLKNAPVITQVITGKDIARRGYSTLQDVMSTEMAGIVFHQAGFGSTISFQGLDARYVLFLIDGERIAGETYGNIDYSRIAVGNIERIEIVKGASSVLYGSNAMGAVVNIITKTPKDKVEIKGSFRYAGYNNTDFKGVKNKSKYEDKLDTPNMLGTLSAGFNTGRFRSLTELTYQTEDAYLLKSRDSEVRHYSSIGGKPTDEIIVAPLDTNGLSVSGYRTYNVAQRFGYKISDKFDVTLAGTYFNKQRYDFKQAAMSMPIPDQPWGYERISGYNLTAGIHHTPNANNVISLTYYMDSYRRGADTLDIVTPKQLHVIHNPRLLWTNSSLGYNRITTGVEFLAESLNLDLTPAGYDHRNTMNTFSMYVQDEISTNIGLSFVAGVRLDANNKYGASLTPKIAAQYDLKHFTFRANYSRGYRSPSLKELYMSYYQPTIKMTITGNPDLKAETNDYISLSAEYFINNILNTSVNVYKSFFRNKIDVRQQDRMLKYENVDKSQYTGIEVMARVKVVKGLFLKADYNYVYVNENTPMESTQYIFPSANTAALLADYTCGNDNWMFNMNFAANYIGAKEYEDRMPIIKFTPGVPRPTVISGVYTARHDAYVTCDAALNFNRRHAAVLTLGATNLFNYKPKVVNFNSALTPGTTLYVSLALRFDKLGELFK